ncbi:TPA: hypothetical protein I7673_22865 [Vibrio vulnificus]|nr:hypothetical protein [Vibrio vulnificus]
MIANTTIVNTHLLTFLKEVLISKIKIITIGSVIAVLMICITIMFVSHTNVMMLDSYNSTIDKLPEQKVSNYVEGIKNLDKITPQISLYHIQEVKLP